MLQSQSRVDLRLVVVAIGIVAVIIYGSLYPFHFRAADVPGGPFRALLSSPFPTDAGDDVSNFLLYLPLGLCVVKAVNPRSRWVAMILIAIAGSGLSLCMEMTQFYDPGRKPEWGDFEWNTAGVCAGALLGALWPQRVQRPFAILMVACWTGNRLFPYFPAINFHAHLSTGAISPVELYKQTVFWLAAGVLLEAIFDAARSRVLLATMAAAIMAARIFVIMGQISTAEVGGAILAVILWVGISRLTRRAAIVTALFVLLVAFQALDPFHFLSRPRAFGWHPFASLIDGPRDNAVRSFLEKAFTYGMAVWLPVRAGVSFRVATCVATAIVLGLRFIQVYLPGRSAEITDAIMVVMLAGLIWLVREPLD